MSRFLAKLMLSAPGHRILSSIRQPPTMGFTFILLFLPGTDESTHFQQHAKNRLASEYVWKCSEKDPFPAEVCTRTLNGR